MPWMEPTPGELAAARNMAEEVNGGNWERDYTEWQKRGWILKVRWAFENLSDRYTGNNRL